MTSSLSVQASWQEGLRCVVQAGRFQLTVDEPASVGGTDRGPQPTELLLASVASCFTLAVAYCADRQGVELADLHVEAIGPYDGPRISSIRVAVRAERPDANGLARLVRAAERVCYVTNTLRRAPEIEIG